MSDDPNKLKATLLEEATTEQQREFAKMLAEECARAELQAKGHRCWFFVPTPTEYEKMRKFNQPPMYDRCPKCSPLPGPYRGRIKIEVYHGNIGSSWNAVCTNKDCDFKEYISDEE